MYIFLSFIIALVSLYYIAVMCSGYNTDTTSLTPAVILLIYSIWSIIRDVKKEDDAFYNNTWYNNRNNEDYYTGRGYNTNRNYNSQSTTYGGSYSSIRENVNTEYFTPDRKVEKSNEKELTHYPTRSEVRAKIKELEKSRWFRFKRSVASIFAIDITEKYYEKYKTPYKVSKNSVVTPINKEDNSRYMPNNSYVSMREKEEIDTYNSISKLVGRSCEISLSEMQETNKD